MNCKQAQIDLALWVGKDLEDKGRRIELKRHLAVCPQCRDSHKQLRGAMSVLHQTDDGKIIAPSKSVWPSVSAGIAYHEESHRLNRFNGWVPAMAVTAACLTLLLFSYQRTSFNSPAAAQVHFGYGSDPAASYSLNTQPSFHEDASPLATRPLGLDHSSDDEGRKIHASMWKNW